MTVYSRRNSDDPDFQALVAKLDADLAIRDGDEHAFYDQFNKTTAIRHVIVCFIDNEPIGCGAFKEYEKGKVEIKRMYVDPAKRGQGTGLGILRELEAWARELEYSNCILETGKKQPEAIRLYEKAGYTQIPNYGQYEHIANSVCMMKVL